MPSKISLFNKEIILQIVRSVGWVSIVYFFGLLISLPIRILMTYSNKVVIHYPVKSLFEYDAQIQLALLLTIPILMSVFLFRFLQVKHSADLMHSLPIKRAKIYHTYTLTGLILLIFPVLLITLIVQITHGMMELGTYFDGKDIWYWAGSTILMNSVLYLSGVFIAMMTGISAVQAILTYIFLFFPVGITMLIYINLRVLLYGFPSDFLLSKNVEKFSPLLMAIGLETTPIQWIFVIGYIVLALILYTLSLFFYKKRKVESAQEAIAFSNLRSVFKYGVTFCMMLFGGVYFSEIQNSNFGWVLFGYILGAVIGYFIAEMVLQKSWRVLGGVKGLIIYGVIVVLLFVSVQMLGFYEKKVPLASDVQSVTITNNPFVFYDDPEMYGDNYVPSPLKSKENKQEVINLHEQIITDKKINQNLADGQYETAFFRYTLKDGSKLIRQYRINKQLYEDSYRKIHETKEYKMATNEIFNLDLKKIDYINFVENGIGRRNVILSDSKDIAEAIHSLKQDILNQSYRDEIYYGGSGSGIELFISKKRSIYLSYQPNFQNLTKWLEEKGLLDEVRVAADDIEKIVVGEMETNDYFDPQEVIKRLENEENTLTITDKETIRQSLNGASSMFNKKYTAVFYYKESSHSEVLFFDDEHAPKKVIQHFN